MMREKIKVLIVDDSAVFRQVLTEILQSDPDIEVIGTAGDPFIAASKMALQAPDVITLDLEMPRMNGLTFLKKIMAQHPIPVVVISDHTEKNRWDALELGAVYVLPKERTERTDFKSSICDIIKKSAAVKVMPRVSTDNTFHPSLSADAVFQQIKHTNHIQVTDKVIVLGAATGGTEAIKTFLQALPLKSPGIVIVQHMPENFTKSFAERLNDLCKIEVKEAGNGDLVLPGSALIAPGNHHLLLKRRGAQYYVEINDGPLVNRHKPSVDVLFRSAAVYAGKNGIGILMTGMGADGAKGLLEMKEAGAQTIAQDEISSVVFGMPKEAIRLNAVGKILPLNEIAPFIIQGTKGWKIP